MLRPIPENPQGFTWQDEVIRMKGCPDCKGRGYFFINPFATGGSNGRGGIGNSYQCPTCKDAHEHYKNRGCLPQDIADAMGVDAVTCMPVGGEGAA